MDLPAFATVAERVELHAAARPAAPALSDDERLLSYAELNALMDRTAAALQREGIGRGHTVATCAAAGWRQAVLFLGALRAGSAVAPLAPSVTAEQCHAMLADSGAALCFADAAALPLLPPGLRCIRLDDGSFDAWLAPPGTRPQPVALQPGDAFNLIYSSGTTGTPKGIVQPHGMRWAHVRRALRYGYDESSVVLLGTPLYSNTTLVAFFPALAFGGHVHLVARFDAAAWLATAQRLRATHTMLVPVQYRRLMALPDFDRHDLRSFRMKLCTSAPFPAALKADVLARWPGGLIEIYGMTEGGASCLLEAHAHPDKLHTVGRPAPGCEVRFIDDAGRELPRGATGEIVGHGPGMMSGYHGRPGLTAEAEWFAPDGRRFIRTGDIGRFDDDGFLVLLDRRKDMIISGGFNLYPSDLEAVLRQHPAVADVAVFGVPSPEWGETPVACVVLHPGRSDTAEDIQAWANTRVGRTQRLHAVMVADELPRSGIGKVLKRELQLRWAGAR